MRYTYEFEFFESEGGILVFNEQLHLYTEGRDEIEAVGMGEDILKMYIEDCLLHNKPIEEPQYNTQPENGGYINLISVEVELEKIKAIPASEAAKHLGVTQGRVSQLLANHRLEGFKKDGIVWVTLDSVNGRMSEKPKAGRPTKKVGYND